MATRNRGLNKYQKAARREGECRVGREDIEHLLRLSCSDDPDERVVAANYLCPCHVRRRIDAVWEALYRMMEDSDYRVRRAAWHTLEDGGCPDDPKLNEIMDRILQSETDSVVRRFVEQFSIARVQQQRSRERMSMRSEFTRQGKCDYCAKQPVAVKLDFDTPIPIGDTTRAALICRNCSEQA